MHVSSVAEFLSVTLQTGSGARELSLQGAKADARAIRAVFAAFNRSDVAAGNSSKLTLRDFSGQQLAEPAPRSRSFHRQNGPRETPVRAQDDLFFLTSAGSASSRFSVFGAPEFCRIYPFEVCENMPRCGQSYPQRI